MAFCKHYKLQDIQPTALTLCMFAEFLARSFQSHQSVLNYISAIRLLHKYLGVSCEAADSFELKLVLRGQALTMDRTLPMKAPVTLQMLYGMCRLCEGCGTNGVVFKCIFLFAWFGFLRISNVVPPSLSSFDASRHLTVEDVFPTELGLAITLKWSKTKQTRGRAQFVQLPRLSGHSLCPVAAFDAVARMVPMRPQAPLFRLPHGSKQVVVTQPMLREAFRLTIKGLGLSEKVYTFHSMRRGGCTFAYGQAVPLEHIKVHGGWTSDSVFRYIAKKSLETTAQVPRALQKNYYV